jgi:hypothetical protein
VVPTEKKSQRYHISWFQAPQDPKSGGWKEVVIDPDVEAVHHSLGVVDLNGDGGLDIVTAGMHQGDDPDEVKLYINRDGRGGAWQKQVVATTGSHNIRAVDIGNDGDYDIFGANWSLSSQVDLWENLTSTTPSRKSSRRKSSGRQIP